jgi:hypothetical protein
VRELPETTASNISRPQILSSLCRLSRRKWSCVELHCETQLRFLRALRRCGCATRDCRRGGTGGVAGFEFVGLSRDRIRRENEKALADLSERIGSLSPREREIMIHLARGRPNISSRLPVSDIDHG